MSLNNAFDNPKTAAKASSVLAIVGLVNIPIIYYSVEWWNSLHQGSSVSVTKVSMQIDMFYALLLISFAFKFLYGTLVLMRSRDEILVREQNSRWVKAIIIGDNK
jgi:heme exporter protein C